MLKQNGYSREYYVIFKKDGYPSWFNRFLHPSFRHVCIACKSDYGNLWMVSDSMGGNIINSLHPMIDIRELFPDTVVMKFKSILREKPQILPCIPSCVTFIKTMLGIRDFKVITPYQLYRYIRKTYENN